MRACVCVPRDLSDEGLLCVCMCVLKHVPKRICMCAHAHMRALPCIMSGVGVGVVESVHACISLCALYASIMSSVCVHAHPGASDGVRSCMCLPACTHPCLCVRTVHQYG